MGFITLTFDDGKTEDFEVMRWLKPFNIPATFYLIADRLIDPNKTEQAYSTRNAKSIIQQYKDGLCEIGAHGYHHLHMDQMNENYFVQESKTAKNILEQHFGPIPNYAFPYGLTSPKFAKWLLGAKIFQSHRLYETPYPDFKELYFPDAFVKSLSIEMLNKSFLHIAGHSNELIRQPREHVEMFIKTALDKGYVFVTVDMFNQKRKANET